MMGVSLCQWRFSIGTFYLKSVPKKGDKEYNGFYYKEHVYTMLLAGAVPLKYILVCKQFLLIALCLFHYSPYP